MRVYLKLVKKKVLTAVLNSEYDVVYHPLGNGRWSVISRSTRMSEVEDGQELPAGTGRGFLWRLNAYWLIEPRGNGVYLECRSISLSRDIPFGLGFAVGPFVKSLPPESLRATLDLTARALNRRIGHSAGFPAAAERLAQRVMQPRGLQFHLEQVTGGPTRKRDLFRERTIVAGQDNNRDSSAAARIACDCDIRITPAIPDRAARHPLLLPPVDSLRR
ncbi:MAG: hypothetical protein WDO18_11455 [Acidobacteriota bacterium]